MQEEEEGESRAQLPTAQPTAWKESMTANIMPHEIKNDQEHPGLTHDHNYPDPRNRLFARGEVSGELTKLCNRDHRSKKQKSPAA